MKDGEKFIMTVGRLKWPLVCVVRRRLAVVRDRPKWEGTCTAHIGSGKYPVEILSI